MKVLVIGSGGREHALVWKINQSDRIKKIFCAPGNGGISDIAETVPIQAFDIEKLAQFAWDQKIDLTFVGPEIPLVAGISDLFQKRGLRVFGPKQYCARLEGSKIFSKQLMRECNVPTAEFEMFTDAHSAKEYIKKTGVPCVIKADGLAAGKGVFVVNTLDEAYEAITKIMEQKIFGDSGDKVIIEECLVGRETSIIVITDGRTILPFVPSQDYKRAFDEGRGPNTGGMGAYSPVDFVSDELVANIIQKCVEPIVKGLMQMGECYKGILYAGLMLTDQGPKVLEYNVRSGDPETQVILPRLKSDLVEMAIAALEGSLNSSKVEWDESGCVTVVACSGGYPGKYEKGKLISGLSQAEKIDDVTVFHAGTKKQVIGPQKSQYFTAGGRVLNITALGNDINQARQRAYEAIEKISFEDMRYRRDIAK